MGAEYTQKQSTKQIMSFYAAGSMTGPDSFDAMNNQSNFNQVFKVC